jgi:hypothetical protein
MDTVGDQGMEFLVLLLVCHVIIETLAHLGPIIVALALLVVHPLPGDDPTFLPTAELDPVILVAQTG